MKSKFLLTKTTICCLLFYGCTKGGLEEATQFAGTYEYEKYSGYPFNFPTSYVPGNGNIIRIYEDGMYERKRNDTLIFRGKFKLINKKDCLGNKAELFLDSPDPQYEGAKIEKIADTLYLMSSNCLADHGTTTYRKIK